MKRNGTRIHGAALGLMLPLAAVACGGEGGAREAQDASAEGLVPRFEVAPDWPRLPGNWVVASGLGLFVDERDHVWFSHRAELAGPEDLAAAAEPPGIPAPLVVELDPSGSVVQAWGHHDEADQWPTVLHGFFVDPAGPVWTSARDQHQIMKFSRSGELLLTIGVKDETGGSNDPGRLGRPSDIWVHPATNELFVVDGYTNRRVIVYDGDTGAYLRHWGAYGEPPVDGGGGRGGAQAEDAGPPRQFSTVHSIVGSHDDLIYVADRQNSRLQVFRPSGEFVAERILRQGGGAAFAVALSHDPDQRFVYVADGTEHKVRILRRSDLEVVGEFGSEGAGPGQFRRPHNIGVDSHGNLYVAEAEPGWRVQKFNFLGLQLP